MRLTHIIVAAITMAIITPVIAEPTFNSFYIVQNNVTKRCEVVDLKPSPNGVFGLVYESSALPESAIAEASKYEIPNCVINR